jgi:hypothetical protein
LFGFNQHYRVSKFAKTVDIAVTNICNLSSAFQPLPDSLRMSSDQSKNASSDFYATFARELQSSIQRHANLVQLLDQQRNAHGNEHLIKSMEIAQARLEMCDTLNRRACEEMDRLHALIRELENQVPPATETTPDTVRPGTGIQVHDTTVAQGHVLGERGHDEHVGQGQRHTRRSAKSTMDAIDLLLAAHEHGARVPSADSRASITRVSDGAVFEVRQRVSFVDPRSKFYVDGVVVAIRGQNLVEVGYWGTPWSATKYNHVVPVDTLLCIGRAKRS